MITKIELADVPVLETDRLLLKKLSLNDAEDIYEYAHEDEVTKYVIWNRHKSVGDSVEFINYAAEEFRNGTSIVWGLEVKNERKVIGTIDLRNFNNEHKCGEIGYCISKKYWNQGFTTEALKAVINFGFERLYLNRLEAHCELENIASWRVMEKAGMIYEGILREKVLIKSKFRSMKMYSILKSDYYK